MDYKYFTFVANLDDLKAQYRAFCKEHHPDLGGDVEIMKAINNEYSERLNSGIFNEEYERTNTSAGIEESLREIIEKTVCLKAISIEICGRWVWFSGETWRYKKYLKEIGCQWASKKNDVVLETNRRKKTAARHTAN
jgi:hypothetical protein